MMKIGEIKIVKNVLGYAKLGKFYIYFVYNYIQFLIKFSISEDVCLECLENSDIERNEYTSRCKCVAGYKWDMKRNYCVKCYIYQDECLLKCPPNMQVDE